jgi:glucose-6-phosphate isomerase
MSLKINYEYYPKVSEAQLESSLKIINKNKEKWDKPFFTDTNSYLDLENIEKVSQPFMNEKIKNVIVLGTGGSIQTLLALKHLSHKKIIPITSSRAVELRECLRITDPADSVVIPISRGGETLDVNSTIGIFLKNEYKFLGLSSKGTMYHLLKEIECPILDVPDLSGRFAGSISNVGIVPAYLSGIKIENFLKGLDLGYKDFLNYDYSISFEFAAYLYGLYMNGYKVVFSMPYSRNLEGSVGLFVQEISESSGKENKGMMGAYQSAPLCQHSVLEYLFGGTKGAVVPILWTIEDESPDFSLPSSIGYIDGYNAQTIVNYQADATFQALIEQGVPCAKIVANDPDEETIGNLISFIQSTIYYLCLLIGVNWANNPKVVIGKKICNEALRNKIPKEKRIRTRKEAAKKYLNNIF